MPDVQAALRAADVGRVETVGLFVWVLDKHTDEPLNSHQVFNQRSCCSLIRALMRSTAHCSVTSGRLVIRQVTAGRVGGWCDLSFHSRGAWPQLIAEI